MTEVNLSEQSQGGEESQEQEDLRFYTRLNYDLRVTERSNDGKFFTEEDELYRHGGPDPIMALDTFCKLVAKSTALGYSVKIGRSGQKILVPLKLSMYFLSINSFLNLYDYRYVYSQYAMLLLEAGLELNIFPGTLTRNPNHRNPQNKKMDGELFNDLVLRIREKSKSGKFRKALYARNYGCKRNFKSAMNYTNTLLESHARLLVIRLDFGYKKEYGTSVTVEEIQRDLAKLLNNRRTNKIFDSNLGYIWKLEYGVEKGVHIHAIFFFDGSAVIKDAYRAQQIKTYWETVVTEKRGLSHNCNRSKYKHYGLGILHYLDIEKRKIFEKHVVGYLTKVDNKLKAKCLDNIRSFGKGEPPKRKSQSGRPRNLKR